VLHCVCKHVHCRTGTCVDGESAIWIYTFITLGNINDFPSRSSSAYRSTPVSWMMVHDSGSRKVQVLFNGRRAIKYLVIWPLTLTQPMWTIDCPYFGTTIVGNTSKTNFLVIDASDSHHSESKLLKCGQTYPVGRKEAKILINEPWVSRAQGSFTVGPYAEGDVVCFAASHTDRCGSTHSLLF
jgi:hypothetical protein